MSAAGERAHAVALDATSAVGAGPVVVLGQAGEPMLRITAGGVEANLASRT